MIIKFIQVTPPGNNLRYYCTSRNSTKSGTITMTVCVARSFKILDLMSDGNKGMSLILLLQLIVFIDLLWLMSAD